MSSLIRIGIRSYAAVPAYCRFYSTSDQISRIKAVLEDVMEKRILQEPVVWKSLGITMATADLGDGFTARLSIGAEDTDTCVEVSDGVDKVYREIPEYWLANWSVADKD